MTFQDFNLAPELLKAIQDCGYSTPTPIQAKAIPVALKGQDLMAGAKTGTGKTAAFTLSLLQNLLSRPIKGKVRALILTPTRELAAQVHENLRVYGKYLRFKSIAVFGGVNIRAQMQKLRAGTDIVVATPGRLLDLLGQGAVNLSQVEILVLDEADRMLDMGFIHDIKKLIQALPPKRQTLLFSATFSNEIKNLASKFLKEPHLIQIDRENTAAEEVSQTIHLVDNKNKRALLSHLIEAQSWEQVLVFTRTKHTANRLSLQLSQSGIPSAAIHGNKTQGQRTKALHDFKMGSVKVLVATDIAARGIDIDQLPQVVNYELPNTPEDYIHRIGRTGRAGNVGSATSLVCIDEHQLLKNIERLIGSEIPKIVLPEFKPDPSIKAQPIRNGQRQGQGRSRFRRRGP